MGTALLIQPLTQTQVQDYLGQFGEPMAGLRDALAGEPALWDLLRTPFLLNVAVRAYHGLPAEDVATEGPTQQRQSRLIAAYVERAVRRKPHGPRFAPSDVVRWLAYCARWMGKNLELFFFVESVNSNWLPKRLRRRVITVTALPASVLLGGSAGLLLHLFIDTWTGIVLGLLATIGFGLGLSTDHGGEVAHASGGNRRALLMEYLGEWAFLGVFGALGLGFAGGAFGALVGTIVGVVGVITGDGSFFAAVIDKGVAGLLIGAVLGVLLPMVQTWGGDRQALRNRPSGAGLRDAVWLCGTSFPVVCVPVTAILGVFYGPDGAVTGVVFGGTAAYLFGGRGLATYWLTRRVLVHGGITPSRPLAFLDFAVAHTLMLRVGGGYMFAHRLLLEHFASLQPEDIPKHYVHEGLSVVDLRPETLLARTVDDARTATPGDAVQAVTYTGSVLPATVWAPSAMKVAETLRARVPATLEPSLYAGGRTPQSQFYETALRAAADVLRMVIAAQHDDLSLVASFQLGDLLTTPVPGVFDSAYDWRDPYMDDAVASLRAITTGGDAALARRAVEMLDKLVSTPSADQG